MKQWLIGVLASLIVCMSAYADQTGFSDQNKKEDVLAALEACQKIQLDPVRDACLSAAQALLAELKPPPADTETGLEAQNTQDIDAQRAALEADRAKLDEDRQAFAKARSQYEAEKETATKSESETVKQETSGASLLSSLTPRAHQDVKIEIIKITLNKRTKLHTFHTSEGVMLRQADDSRRFRAPSGLPASATLDYRIMGSKWLIFDEHPDRSLKVSILELD